MSFKKYLGRLAHKKIAIIGLAKSNVPLINFLIKNKIKYITGCDKKTKRELEAYPELLKLPITFSLGKNYLKDLQKFDIVFLSPGVPKDLPEVKKAKAYGAEILSEIKLFFDLCPAPIIGVTGTNGKTTTVALIGEILLKSKIKKAATRRSLCDKQKSKIFIGGNIGEPLINKLEKIKKQDLVVLELSSFQLEDLKKSPHIALVLNITPDHLDRHYKFSDYIKAKKNIIKFQNKNDWAVLNFDNKIVKNFQKECKGRVFSFSRLKKIKKGAQVENGCITVKNDNIVSKICSINEIKLLGPHNIENVLAACAFAYLVGVKSEQIKEVITKFSGLEHRLEFVTELNGVKFYNDSKATTPESTACALKSFDKGKIILIAGGYDKKVNFSKLACEIINRKVRHLILIGETKDKIRKAVQNVQIVQGIQDVESFQIEQGRRSIEQIPIYRNDRTNKVIEPLKIHYCKDLYEAVKLAKQISQSGDIILLSPACASYDMFSNFEERGKKFKQFILDFK